MEQSELAIRKQILDNLSARLLKKKLSGRKLKDGSLAYKVALEKIEKWELKRNKKPE